MNYTEILDLVDGSVCELDAAYPFGEDVELKEVIKLFLVVEVRNRATINPVNKRREDFGSFLGEVHDPIAFLEIACERFEEVIRLRTDQGFVGLEFLELSANVDSDDVGAEVLWSVGRCSQVVAGVVKTL